MKSGDLVQYALTIEQIKMYIVHHLLARAHRYKYSKPLIISALHIYFFNAIYTKLTQY